MKKPYWIITITGGLAALVASIGCGQAPEAKIMPATESEVSYKDFASVLKAYVDDNGNVNYAELKKNREALDRFAVSLASLSPAAFKEWDKKAQLALWMNAYNAYTLISVIDHYPIKKGGLFASRLYPANSIRQIPGVWAKLEWTVMGRRITLNDMEHEVLRKDFKEPRIHMAIVCASIGCPFLRNEPYEAEKLDEQLDGQSRAFLSDNTKFSIGQEKGVVMLSSIFDWFGGDFLAKHETKAFGKHGNEERAVLNFISKYVDEKDAEYLRAGKYEIEYLDYDWGLNEQ